MRSRNILLVMGCVFAAIIGYAAARATGQETDLPSSDVASQALATFLELDDEQAAKIAAHDPKFADDLVRLRQTLNTKREELALAMEDVNVSEEVMWSRLQEAFAADHALEQRVMEYLMAIRDHLTPTQQQKLFALAADGIRRGGGYCRSLLGPGTGPGRGAGLGQGQGRGLGQGQGRGQGMRRGMGQGQ
jgi:hypothetical protein